MSASAHALNHEIIDDLRSVLGDGFNDILDEQLEQAGHYLVELEELLRQGDSDQAMRKAHALKSSVGQVGLQGIYALAKELEFMCNSSIGKRLPNTHALELLRLLSDEFPAAVENLRRYANQETSQKRAQLH